MRSRSGRRGLQLFHTVAAGLAQLGPRALTQGREELFQPQGGSDAAAAAAFLALVRSFVDRCQNLDFKLFLSLQIVTVELFLSQQQECIVRFLVGRGVWRYFNPSHRPVP